MAFDPIVFSRDGKQVTASNAAEAAQLRWEGWIPGGSAPPYEDTFDEDVAQRVKTGPATKAALGAALEARRKVAAVVSADGAAAVDKHNPVDASGGARTITLPTGQAEGAVISVEKTDASTNIVTVSGSIRGTAAQTRTLEWQYQTLQLLADSAGSWWPVADHKTRTALETAFDARYARLGAAVHPVVRRRDATTTKLTEGTGTLTAAGTGSTLTDTSDFVLGTSAVKLISDGASGFSNYTFQALGSPVNMSAATLRLYLKLDSYSGSQYWIVYVGDATLSNRFVAQISESALATTQRVAREGEWLVLDMPRDMFTVDAGSPSWSTISNVRIVATDTGSGNKVTCHINGWGAVPNVLPNGGAIFTFDDNFASQLALAKPYLDKYGAPGVIYPIADATGITVNQMKQLRDVSGWEIGIHAMSGPDHTQGFAGLTATQIRAKFDALKTWAASNGFAGDTMAWPNGNSDPTAEAIAREYVSAARSTAPGIQSSAFPNPMRLRAVNLAATATANLAAATAKVDAAKADKELVVFLVHGVVASSPTGNDALASVVQGVIDYVAAQGVPFYTLSGAMRALGVL